MINVHAIAPFMPSYYNMNDFREVNTKGKIKGGGEATPAPTQLVNDDRREGSQRKLMIFTTHHPPLNLRGTVPYCRLSGLAGILCNLTCTPPSPNPLPRVPR